MEELIKQFNLPDYLKTAKSFSDASKMIMNKFGEREDPTSKRTMNEMMGRLRDAQEFIKQQIQPEPIFSEGGPQAPIDGEIAEQYGKDANTFNLGGLFSGALKGASAGSALGPVGTIGGALVGGITSLFGDDGKQEMLDMQRDQVQGNRAQVLNTFKGGGKMTNKGMGYAYGGMKYRYGGMNKYQNGGPIDLLARGFDNLNQAPDLASTTPIGVDQSLSPNARGFDALNTVPELASTTARGVSEPSFLEGLGSGFRNLYDDVREVAGPPLSQAEGFLSDNADALRYAPAAINALQYANLEQAAPTTLDRLDARYSPEFADEQALQNIAREQFGTTNEALAGASGGSTSALRSNILASGLNRARSVSDAYQRAAAANRAESRAGQQFDLRTDQANLAQSNLEGDIRARDAGAFETQRSGALTRLGQDLGNIGKEEAQQDIIEQLYGYSPTGEYLRRRRPVARGASTLRPRPGFATPDFAPLNLTR